MRKSILAAALVAAVMAGSTPAVICGVAQAQPTTAAPAEDARLTAFLDAEFAQELKDRPVLAARLGLKEGKDRIDDNSDAAQLKRLEWRRASVARMKAQFDRGKLSPDAQASYDIWALELDRAELGWRYRRYTPPFYSYLYPLHSELANLMISLHGVQDASDVHAYAARLRAIPGVLDVGIEQSRRSDAEGIRAPRFQLERVIGGSRTLITGAPFDDGADNSPLWADAKAKIGRLRTAGKVTPQEAEALLAEVRAALLEMAPGYQRVIAWAQGDLPAAPSGRVGAVSLPGGTDYYAAALKIATTTDLTADQIHAIGLREVAQVEQAQDALARQAGFKDRDAYYAERARLFPPTPWTDASRAEKLRQANAIVANIRTLLPAWFGQLPAYRMEVIREPSFTEVAGGAAHASFASPDGVRPGRVYLHLLGVSDDPAWLYTLMCHEGIPGHLLQGDIPVRQTGGPKFRKSYGYVAFNEGWGLYAEALCKEMGAFPDVAANFMRLDAELFRAARLVVDTGIHAKGWTEDQAVDYMIRTGRRPPAQARSEVRRYITVPGQATGYKIGMLEIVKLRAKAQRELGVAFDIKAFHDLLVGSGSLPLSVLDRRVDQWIAAQRKPDMR